MVDPHIRRRWEDALAGRQQEAKRAAALFTDLLALMADLRGPHGCPWDAEQSLASLRQYVREEADEVYGAVDKILELEAQLRHEAGLAPADPTPPQGLDKARTPTKGLTIAHHPHRPDFDPSASASAAPLPAKLTSSARQKLTAAYADLGQELGDLLLQAAFMGDILAAMGRPGVEGSLEYLIQKLIRRHPHVYGDREVADSAEVLANWEQIKRDERDETH